MNFLTFTFLIFLPLSIFCYYLCPKKAQNMVLLAANYIFYLWSLPSLGVYLVISTLVAYLCARAIECGFHRRFWLIVGILYLFGMLLVFKYLDFVCQTFLRLAGSGTDFQLGLILPIGISFYSFSLAGYLFDVYREKMAAERNLLRFAALASFFPSVLSGPILRARDFLPQLSQARRFDLEQFKSGLWRFLCGAGKKLILSSMLLEVIEPVYSSPYDYGSGMWLLTAVAYSIYIYIDFAAYSDMAIGIARMLGLMLMENFCAPYLSRSVQQFWKKWHISLTSWFREYLYFPLGGSRGTKYRTWFNILIVFAVSGLWHGAGFTFLIWGLLNGMYQVVGEITQPLRTGLRKRLHIGENAWYVIAFQGVFTFSLITVAWIFFRAVSMEQAIFILKRIALILRDGCGPIQVLLSWRKLSILFSALALCVVEDVRVSRGKQSFRIERTTFRYWIGAAVLACVIFLFGQYGPGYQAQDFVYFRF